MIKLNNIVLASVLAVTVSTGCNQKSNAKEPNLTQLKFTVEEAPEWSSLFIRNNGWLGGDGIFAVTMNGLDNMGAAENNETMLWFSDTQIGNVVNDTLQKAGDTLTHNSVAFLKGVKPEANAISFYWDKLPDNRPTSVFVPQTPASTPEDYYWMGDGFVNTAMHNDIYMFGYRVKSTIDNPGFSFKVTGNTLIHIPAGSPPQLANKKQVDIPFYLGKDVDSIGCFGAGILVNTKDAGEVNPDGYVYIYGVRKGELLVSRVLPENIEQFNKWTFWNGKDWTTDAYAVKTVTDHVSNELSVSALGDGRYILVFQTDGVSNNVAIRLGASPVGPFGPIINIYDTKDSIKSLPHQFAYNAKAHPLLSKPGELLITYNVNSTDYFNDIKKAPHLYRPRFIKLKYELDK